MRGRKAKTPSHVCFEFFMSKIILRSTGDIVFKSSFGNSLSSVIAFSSFAFIFFYMVSYQVNYVLMDAFAGIYAFLEFVPFSFFHFQANFSLLHHAFAGSELGLKEIVLW